MLIAAATVVGALASAGAAQAAEDWDDSELQFSLIQNCLTGDVEAGLGAYVSVLRDRAALPSTGTVFYGRTVAAVVGNNCTGHAVRLEVTPPPGLSFAISPSTPVRCFTRDIPTGVTTAMAPSRCPQILSAPLYGGAAAFDPADGGSTWDVLDSTAVEIQFPLVATSPLVGNLVSPCDCLRAFTKVIDTWDNPILRTFIEVAVGGAAPAPAPAPAPAAAPPPPPPADTKAPSAALSGSMSQKLAKTVAVSVACTDEPCRATAGGTVRVPKRGRVKAKTYKLQAVTSSIARGEKVTLKPKLTASARSAVKRALKAGKRIVVNLSVRATDAAGNARTLTRKVRLKL